MRTAFAHLEPDYLVEYEKGGGGGQMAMMMMMMQQERQREEAQRIAAEAQRKEDQRIADEKAATQKAADIRKSTSRVNKSYNATLNEARQNLINQGYQGQALEDMMGKFTASLDKVKGGLPEIVENANEYFNTDPLAGIVSTANSTFRTGLNKQLDEFIGSDFAKGLVGDTMDDAIINATLGTQYDEAKGVLDRALARGSINDLGYSTGLTELSRQKTAGLGKAQELGGGVLSGYRGELGSAAEGIRKSANEALYGSTFDVAGNRNKILDLDKAFDTRLEGDILNAIGGTNFFDTDLLLGKAGKGSGIMNTGIGNTSGTGTIGTGSAPLSVLSPLDSTKATNTLDDEEARRRAGVF